MVREKFGLKLENVIPTDDTFQRIFDIIKPEQLEKCFRNWVKSVFSVSSETTFNGYKVKIKQPYFDKKRKK